MALRSQYRRIKEGMGCFYECHDNTALLAKGQSFPHSPTQTINLERKKLSRTYRSLKLRDLGKISCQITLIFPIQAFLVLFKCVVLVCVERRH